MTTFHFNRTRGVFNALPVLELYRAPTCGYVKAAWLFWHVVAINPWWRA